MTTMRYQQALRLAMTEEMERDDRVFICGEEVGQYQGTYRVTEGMLQKFGPERVVDTPISEIGIAGSGVLLTRDRIWLDSLSGTAFIWAPTLSAQIAMMKKAKKCRPGQLVLFF